MISKRLGQDPSNSPVSFPRKRESIFLLFTLWCTLTNAAPNFIKSTPNLNSQFLSNPETLCKTAKSTLEYLNKGSQYDPTIIHQGEALPIPLKDIKATLDFICSHQNEMNNPQFIQTHFDFIQWQPDLKQAKIFSKNKPLVKNIPPQKILMTRYYVHSARGSAHPTPDFPYALYSLPADEEGLPLDKSNLNLTLTRFKYGKQAILKGALEDKKVKPLVYLNREDLEAALLQGTIVVQINGKQKIFNVNRNNNIAYDRHKSPYEQERYWYFKEVDGIKGYGKDAEYKITVAPEVTFAADLEQFGLGKVLLINYPDNKGQPKARIGIFADTGGAFAKNLYQIDFLSGIYPTKETCYKSWTSIPDYVNAYFMVLKKEYITSSRKSSLLP